MSEECVGIAEAGGIGACVRGLSQWLAESGCEVDVLITNLAYSAGRADHSDTTFAHRVFFLADVAAASPSVQPPADEPSKGYHVYLFLKGRDYDEVHFHDFVGAGFYTAMARRMGMFSAKVVTHLHGCSQWVRRHNLSPPELRDLELEALERSLIENSDAVTSPSRYMLDWCRSESMSLPDEAIQRSWVLPPWLQPDAITDGLLRTRAIQPGEIDEIVFFGRQERRKGFRLFVDAIAALSEGSRPDITFVGRFDRIASEHTGSYALRKLADYAGRLRFLNDFKQPEALRLLKRSRRALVVMPSLVENSPCVVGECFTMGVPFLATDVGGTAELVEEASRAYCLTEPNPAALSRAILRVLTEGMPELVSTLQPRQIMESWKAPVPACARAPAGAQPLVSVCFAHHERPHLLRRALDAILAQTYENVEIIVADDGSRSPGALAYLDELEAASARFPISVVRAPNRYLGAARNSAAKLARGEYLLFHDDDNYAEPNEIETFVSAALNFDADILTSRYYVFREGEQNLDGPKRETEFYTFGIGGEFSFFANRFGDANALIRRSVFEEIGGFTEQYGVCFEDWEFFLKAHLAGKRMGIVPEPLFNYRASSTGMLATGDAQLDYERIFGLIDKLRPRLGADLVRLAYREPLTQLSLGRTRQILARERGAEPMQRLAEVDPNSREAIALLSDLAMTLGRFTDAVELASRDRESQDRVAALMRDPAVTRRLRGSFELVTLEPTTAHDAAFVVGWAVDGEGRPLDPSVLWIGDRWWRISAIRRERRPDVREALRLSSEVDLGFRIYAFEPTHPSEPPEPPQPDLFDSSAPAAVVDVEDRPWRPIYEKPFELGDFECNLPGGPGWRGHIERGEWQRSSRILLPEALDGAPIVEIETSTPSDPAILWADGVLDWGERTTGNRLRFSRGPLGLGREITVIAPSNARVFVAMS